MRKPAKALWGGLTAAAFVLSGCSGMGSTSTPAPADAPATAEAPAPADVITQAQIDEAMNTPTTLTYWSWASFIVPAIEQFELKYPNINVELVNNGVNVEQYTKINNALTSGSGAPDLAMVDYRYVPQFVLSGALADLTPFGGAELEADYNSATWAALTTADGQIVGLPQNVAPMTFFYRSDLFEEAGITSPPETWDEFLAAGATLKESTGALITSLEPGNPGLALGLLQQAGAGPFTYDGVTTVGIDLTSPKAKEVADLLTAMVASGTVGIEPASTPDWYQALMNDTYGGWLNSAPGQNNLINNVPDQTGMWAIASTPQWAAGENANGNIGGSATVILENSPNKIAAYELAKFLFNDPTIVIQGSNRAFPALKTILEAELFIEDTSEYFGGVQANKLYAEAWDAVVPTSGSLPFSAYVDSVYNDTVGKALTEGTDVFAAFGEWETELIRYAEEQGFTVN